MTPDDIARWCEAWTRVDSASRHAEFLRGERPTNPHEPRRVVCVEPDGPRRTWLLFEGGRQVGHIRLRSVIDIAQRGFGGDDGVFSTAWIQSLMRDSDGDMPWPSQVEALLKHPSVTPLKGGCHWRHDGRDFDGLPWTWEAAGAGREVLGG